MPKTKQPPRQLAWLETIEQIKSKGFTHIKLELEAQLNRGEADDECTDCDAGWENCLTCNGDGIVYMDNTQEDTEECNDCYGQGNLECSTCSGRGRSRDGYSVKWCQEYIESKITLRAKNALVYGEFYEDGSVDSEYTFTMPIEDAPLCIEVIEAFNDLNNEINGRGLPNVDNAGMHLSILPSGDYPCERGLLNNDYMKNFRNEVKKLLPALYFVATHQPTTRRLEYRLPYVSNSDKYSAIFTHGDTCMEFRIFDTCYEAPESLLEKLQIVAATLKYYSDEKVNVKYKEFHFPYEVTNNDSRVATWYGYLENLEALNQTLPLLKPKNKSIKALKEERRMATSKKLLLKSFREYMQTLETEYMKLIQKQENVDNLRIEEWAHTAVKAYSDGTLGPYWGTTLLETMGGDEKLLRKTLCNLELTKKLAKKHSKALGIRISYKNSLREYAKQKLLQNKYNGLSLIV